LPVPSPGDAPWLPDYFPYPARASVRVREIRGGGAQVGGAEVIVADQLELTLVRLVRNHAAIAGRLTDGLA
jgi:hypothetical protein